MKISPIDTFDTYWNIWYIWCNIYNCLCGSLNKSIHIYPYYLWYLWYHMISNISIYIYHIYHIYHIYMCLMGHQKDKKDSYILWISYISYEQHPTYPTIIKNIPPKQTCLHGCACIPCIPACAGIPSGWWMPLTDLSCQLIWIWRMVLAFLMVTPGTRHIRNGHMHGFAYQLHSKSTGQWQIHVQPHMYYMYY